MPWLCPLSKSVIRDKQSKYARFSGLEQRSCLETVVPHPATSGSSWPRPCGNALGVETDARLKALCGRGEAGDRASRYADIAFIKDSVPRIATTRFRL